MQFFMKNCLLSTIMDVDYDKHGEFSDMLAPSLSLPFYTETVMLYAFGFPNINIVRWGFTNLIRKILKIFLFMTAFQIILEILFNPFMHNVVKWSNIL